MAGFKISAFNAITGEPEEVPTLLRELGGEGFRQTDQTASLAARTTQKRSGMGPPASQLPWMPSNRTPAPTTPPQASGQGRNPAQRASMGDTTSLLSRLAAESQQRLDGPRVGANEQEWQESGYGGVMDRYLASLPERADSRARQDPNLGTPLNVDGSGSRMMGVGIEALTPKQELRGYEGQRAGDLAWAGRSGQTDFDFSSPAAPVRPATLEDMFGDSDFYYDPEREAIAPQSKDEMAFDLVTWPKIQEEMAEYEELGRIINGLGDRRWGDSAAAVRRAVENGESEETIELLKRSQRNAGEQFENAQKRLAEKGSDGEDVLAFTEELVQEHLGSSWSLEGKTPDEIRQDVFTAIRTRDADAQKEAAEGLIDSVPNSLVQGQIARVTSLTAGSNPIVVEGPNPELGIFNMVPKFEEMTSVDQWSSWFIPFYSSIPLNYNQSMVDANGEMTGNFTDPLNAPPVMLGALTSDDPYADEEIPWDWTQEYATSEAAANPLNVVSYEKASATDPGLGGLDANEEWQPRTILQEVLIRINEESNGLFFSDQLTETDRFTIAQTVIDGTRQKTNWTSDSEFGQMYADEVLGRFDMNLRFAQSAQPRG